MPAPPPLHPEDLPLGPFAAADLTFWSTPKGRRRHADPNCPSRPPSARPTTLRLPKDATYANLNIHCAPPGPQAAHLAACQALLTYAQATEDAWENLTSNHLTLSAIPTSPLPTDHPALTQPPFTEIWERCLARRAALVDELLTTTRPRFPLMIAAATLRWSDPHFKRVRSEGFEAFTEAAPAALQRMETRRSESGLARAIADVARRHVLDPFLERIENGLPPAEAMRPLAEKEWKRAKGEADLGNPVPFDEIGLAWMRVGEIWTDMLRGSCAMNSGSIFAIFEVDKLPFDAEVLNRLYPYARIRTTSFTWAAGNVPAAFRLLFRERSYRSLGLELEQSYYRLAEPGLPGLFLRNLLTHLDMGDLTVHVEDVGTGTDAPPVEVDWSRRVLFRDGMTGDGIAPVHCYPALRAAMDGETLEPSEFEWDDVEDDEEEFEDEELASRILELLREGDRATLLSAVQLHVRREQLAEVRAVVERRSSKEGDLQKALAGAWWVFGGEYVGEFFRRRLVETTEVDIPLLRPDGVLQLVELKTATAPAVTEHRNKLIPSGDVHRAVGQVLNYLTLLDESRNELLERWQVDVRRAGAVVVVGHPKFQEGVDEGRSTGRCGRSTPI